MPSSTHTSLCSLPTPPSCCSLPRPYASLRTLTNPYTPIRTSTHPHSPHLQPHHLQANVRFAELSSESTKPETRLESSTTSLSKHIACGRPRAISFARHRPRAESAPPTPSATGVLLHLPPHTPPTPQQLIAHPCSVLLRTSPPRPSTLLIHPPPHPFAPPPRALHTAPSRLPLHTDHFTLVSSHLTLHTSPFTPHPSHLQAAPSPRTDPPATCRDPSVTIATCWMDPPAGIATTRMNALAAGRKVGGLVDYVQTQCLLLEAGRGGAVVAGRGQRAQWQACNHHRYLSLRRGAHPHPALRLAVDR